VGGAGAVAGQGGYHRADLLVAGGQQEGGSAAVALHPYDHVAGFGVGELGDTVGGHGAAGVDVGVDQWGQRGRALQGRLQAQAELGGDRVAGAEPGGGDHLVGLDSQAGGVGEVLAVQLVAEQPDAVAGRLDRVDPEAGAQLDAAAVDQGG
jgi:hypothetical protein